MLLTATAQFMGTCLLSTVPSDLRSPSAMSLTPSGIFLVPSALYSTPLVEVLFPPPEPAGPDALPVVVPLVPCSFIGAASSLSAGGCEP